MLRSDAEAYADRVLLSRAPSDDAKQVYRAGFETGPCLGEMVDALLANGTIEPVRHPFQEGRGHLAGGGWVFDVSTNALRVGDLEHGTLTAWGDGTVVVKMPKGTSEDGARRFASETLAAKGAPAPTFEEATFARADC